MIRLVQEYFSIWKKIQQEEEEELDHNECVAHAVVGKSLRVL